MFESAMMIFFDDDFLNLYKQGQHTQNWMEDYGICCHVIGLDTGSADVHRLNCQWLEGKVWGGGSTKTSYFA